ncbi:MAG: hypothetical protein LBE87_09420, partial [Serratia marcescens]|nr:hypothetical protein [Serratia marcescens]
HFHRREEAVHIDMNDFTHRTLQQHCISIQSDTESSRPQASMKAPFPPDISALLKKLNFSIV